ncbi:MAG: DHHA1 domain-containing protein [Bacteroidales bacterium]
MEAVTGAVAENYVNEFIHTVDDLKELLKNQKELVKGVQNLMDQNSELKKQIEHLNSQKAGMLKDELKQGAEKIGEINFVACKVELDMAAIKNLAFELNRELENSFVLLGSENDGKANLTLIISENLVNDKKLNAGTLIREIAKHIQGGGGGQPHFATAGGKNPAGMNEAFAKAKEIVAAG